MQGRRRRWSAYSQCVPSPAWLLALASRRKEREEKGGRCRQLGMQMATASVSPCVPVRKKSNAVNELCVQPEPGGSSEVAKAAEGDREGRRVR